MNVDVGRVGAGRGVEGDALSLLVDVGEGEVFEGDFEFGESDVFEFKECWVGVVGGYLGEDVGGYCEIEGVIGLVDDSARGEGQVQRDFDQGLHRLNLNYYNPISQYIPR